MSEELEVVEDAPVPDQPEAADAAEEVIEEQKAEEASDSSTDTQEPEEDPVQKRIDELTKKHRSAEREADYWRNLAQQNAKQEEPQKAPEPESVKTLEDFDYDEAKYQAHLFEQARRGSVEEAKRLLKEEQAKEAELRKVSEYTKRVGEFSSNVKDFDEVVRNPTLSINQHMAEVAIEMDNGPEVLYYLGKNPDIADQISSMSPLMAAREMGRIEANIEAKKKSTQKVSKTPAPTPKIEAVESKVNVDPSSAESDKMSTKEWLARRQKQIAKRY